MELKVVTSSLFRALKMLAPEFIRLRGLIRVGYMEALLSAINRNILSAWRDGGPKPKVTEGRINHHRLPDKKTVKQTMAVLEQNKARDKRGP